MIDRLQEKIQDTLRIREGESERLVPFLVLIFLTLTTLLLVKPTITSLFLSELGAKSLPLAFILVAAVAGVTTVIYAYFSRRRSLLWLIHLIQALSILILLGFASLLYMGVPLSQSLFAFYIWSTLFGLLAVSQVYLLAGEIFDIREAKRLFNWIGAAAISGGIFGGYLTSALATLTTNAFILTLAAALLVVCFVLSQYLWRFKKPSLDKPAEVQEQSLWAEINYPYKTIRQSRHLQYIALLVGISVVVAKLIEYQYGSIAAEVYTDSEDLTAFFGFWMSTISVVSLGVQILVTQRMLSHFGVTKTLLLLPIGILLASICLLLFPVLWAAILARLMDGSFKQSANKSGVELLLLPVPNQEKRASKTFIDVFIDSLATGLSGFILIFFVDQYGLPTQAVAILTILLVAVWLWVIHRLSEEYLNAFRLRLSDEKLTPKQKKKRRRRENVMNGLVRTLEHGKDRQLIYVLNHVKTLAPQKIFEAPLLNLLEHPNDEVRALAISSLVDYRNITIEDRAEKMLRTDSASEVKVQALLYLANRQKHKKLIRFNAFLDDKDPVLASAALVGLAIETRHNPVLRDMLRINDRIELLLDEIDRLPPGSRRDARQLFAVKVIRAARSTAYMPLFVVWLHTATREVGEEIFRSISQLQEKYFLPVLLTELNGDWRHHAGEALAKYEEESLIPFLERQEPTLEHTTITMRAIPEVVKRLQTQRAVDYLFAHLNYPDQVVRTEILKALNDLQQAKPNLSFDQKRIQRQLLNETHLYAKILSLLYAQLTPLQQLEVENEVTDARRGLVKLLEKRLDRNLERIFRLLGLKYATSDILQIYRNLQSNQEDLRINALEFLDNLLEPSLRDQVIPIAEAAMMGMDHEARIQRLSMRVPSEEECFRELMQMDDHRLILSLLYLIRRLGEATYIDMITPLIYSTHPVVRLYASETITMLETDSVSVK